MEDLNFDGESSEVQAERNWSNSRSRIMKKKAVPGKRGKYCRRDIERWNDQRLLKRQLQEVYSASA